MVQFVAFLVRTRNCGLSMQVGWLRQPPAVRPFHPPLDVTHFHSPRITNGLIYEENTIVHIDQTTTDEAKVKE